MKHSPFASALILAALLLSACADAGSSRREATGGAGTQTRARQTLNAIMSIEPVSLAAKPFQSTGISIAFATRLFNAHLDQMDARANAQPYLAEALPKVNTDSWLVFPDGRMETRYTLKPNLTW